MPVSPLVNLGSTVTVGYNGRTYGTLLEVTATEEPMVTIKPIKDDASETKAKLLTNPRKQLTVRGVMLSADLAALEALEVGSTISLNSVNHMLVSLDLDFQGEEARCTIVGIKEDSMTYS